MSDAVGLAVPGWLGGAVVARVAPDGLDLGAVAGSLDAVAAAGATAVWLPPVFSSPSPGRLAAYDLLAIDPLLGGEAALRGLLERAHARGMRVLADAVVSACGRGSWPFNHVLEVGSASPYRDWFVLDPTVVGVGRGPDAYPDGDPAPGRELGYGRLGDDPALPRFDLRNPEVQAFLAGALETWTRAGMDGWRLHGIADAPPAFRNLVEARVLAANPEAAVVGAGSGDPIHAWLAGEAGFPHAAATVPVPRPAPGARPTAAVLPGSAGPFDPHAPTDHGGAGPVDTDPPAWVRDAVFYQVVPDRFARSGRVHAPGPLEPWDEPPTGYGFKGGDLYGVADHLDHIADLGANAIYLNPIFSSASNHRYHTYDYFSIDPLLGGEAAFRHLLDAAHARGIRVIVDGVFNHCGRGFWAFNHVMEAGAASPYRDWFVLNPSFLDEGRPLRAFSPGGAPELELSAADLGSRDGTASLRELGYQAWWDLPPVPKLDVRNPEVREYLLRAGEHWIRFGADGWRLDVPEDLGDRDFWRAFRRRVRAVNPEAYILAEVWFPLDEVLRGDMYDATMAYGFLTAVASYAGGASIDRSIASQHGWLADGVIPEDGPTFAGRLERLLTQFRPEVTAVQYNLVGSHDTPRILSVLGGDRDALRLATVVQATVPGAPAVYYGDEIGMTGSIDPHARAAFPWSRPDTWDQSIRGFMRDAFRLRHAEPVLRHGTFRIAGAQGSVVAWLRVLGDRVALVACNNGAEAESIRIDAPELRGRSLVPAPLPGRTVDSIPSVPSDGLELVVPPRTGVVLLG